MAPDTIRIERSRDNRERALMDAVLAFRSSHGDELADRAVAVLLECITFIRQGGHGNVTLAVKNHRVAPQVRIEYFKEIPTPG